MAPRLGTFVLLALALLLIPSAAEAGPQDVRPGETLVTWKNPSTDLRAKGSGLASVVAAVPYGHRVTVLEVKQPWIRVRAAEGEGWMRSAEAVKAGALAQNPAPVHTTAASAAGVSMRDVSAAGRQFDGATERRYRASRQDLQRAYGLVDEIERETQALHPTESIAFIVGVALGRPGQDYARPARLPPTPEPARAQQPQPQRGGGIARGLGGLLGPLADRVGVKREHVEAGLQAAGAMVDSAKQLTETFTPEHEYYLGRAVAANAIATYGLDPSPERRRYVRLIGDAIVRLTTRLPSTFGGYHFDVLNSDDVNGISGPGGFVFLTRGALMACRTEDEVAGLICHELAHVVRKDGETTLKQGRAHQTRVQGFLGAAGKATGAEDERWGTALLDFFKGAVGEMARTSMEHNYGRAAEFGADLEGTYILFDVAYNHAALRDMLKTLPGGAYGRAATHSPPSLRATQLDPVVLRYRFPGSERVKEVRKERLDRTLGR